MNYRHFAAALYFSRYDINRFEDAAAFEKKFAFFEKHVRPDKVYLETHRSGRLTDEAKLLACKDFFRKKGIRTSGGITPNARKAADWGFNSLCYSDPAQLEFLREAVVRTARLFDEIIIDDFFFDNCRCERCIAAKGALSWSEFRTARLRDVSGSVFLAPARAANPRVKLVIKYPNWYEHYQGAGYNLKDQPGLFDFIYTGTETRDPVRTQQSLPRYASYFIMRYLSNAAPGKNNGGWFDTFDCSYNPNAYVEQALLTLYAKPAEVTLFCAGLMLARDRIFTPLAGFAFDRADAFLGKLGAPRGLACYRPFHSRGEDYLHGYLGMLGFPLEPTPFPPEAADAVLLTESAAQDERIVTYITSLLRDGKTVIVTSGLVKALAGRGWEGIAEIAVLEKRTAVGEFGCLTHDCSFKAYCVSRDLISLPEVAFFTNDVQQIVVGISDGRNVPVLLETRYGRGRLFVLAVPDDGSDLCKLPREALDALRKALLKDMPVRLGAPAGIGLFLYDNETFIVHSFLPFNQKVEIVVAVKTAVLTDMETGERLPGRTERGRMTFGVLLRAGQARVFTYRHDRGSVDRSHAMAKEEFY